MEECVFGGMPFHESQKIFYISPFPYFHQTSSAIPHSGHFPLTVAIYEGAFGFASPID